MTSADNTERTIRLASIVAVDMAGFSSLSERDQRRAARHVETLRARIEAIAAAHEGRLFNTAGDGFMLEFASAGAALGAIQDLLDKRPKGEPDIRVGAHVGDVVVTATNDLLGHGVNVAARLEALAAPNTALVSSEFRSMARNSPSAVFMSKGRQPLENIDQRVHTFAILSQQARRKRLLTRVGVGAGVLAAAAVLAFFTPMALDLLQRQPWLRPAATASDVKTEAPPAPVQAAVSPAPAAPAEKTEAPAALTPGSTFQDCETCPQMTIIAGGVFDMGSPEGQRQSANTERPVRQVRLAPFAIGVHEVTFEQWDACVAAQGCRFSPPERRSGGRGRRPVVGVSWNDAMEYVNWLNRTTGGPAYRLPSEAEWEYAARAGATTLYAFGDAITTTQAVFSRGRNGITDPVGQYAANAWGLYDMHGNAAEWVGDCYNGTYANLPVDGGVVISGDCNRRVYRGGSFADAASVLRSANRRAYNKGLRDGTIGFRVVRALN